MPKTEKQEKEVERRRYFRVDDEAFFSHRMVSDGEKDELIAKIKSGQDLCPDNYHTFVQLEAEINDVVDKMKNQDPELAESFELLNRKMNLISKGPPPSETRNSLFDTIPVRINLSGCGIGFFSHEEYPDESIVCLEMVLLPSKSYICCLAEVKNARKVVIQKQGSSDTENSFRIGADFQHIRPEDSEKIIQHVIKREVEVLREKRRS